MSRNPFLSLFKRPKRWKTKRSSHPRDSRARFRPLVEQLETRLLPSLVINAIFDSTITKDPNAATIERTINTAIPAAATSPMAV